MKNHLLAALSGQECDRLAPDLQLVTFSLGEVIYEAGARLDYVYFPTTCVVSLIYTMQNGSTAEVGLAGNDSVVGTAVFLGGGATPDQAIAQVAGEAFRLKARRVQEEFARGEVFQRMLLRYTQALITQ